MPTQVEPEMGAPSSNTGKLFSLTDVYRIYGEEPVAVHALDGVSVEINSGDFMASIGPSGSGKSTLLGLLGCLDLPSRGSIKVSGTEVTELDDAESSKLRGDSIGFVFQQFHLIPHLTALGNVSTVLLYRNMSKNERKDRAMVGSSVSQAASQLEHSSTAPLAKSSSDALIFPWPESASRARLQQRPASTAIPIRGLCSSSKSE